jgi:uncharacterized protein YifE (UPF0438 family)
LKKESPITEGDIFFMPNFKASYWTRSVQYPSTRIVLQDHIYMDVPTAYMDINPLGPNNKGYYNARTLNREGKFTNDQSSLIISAYGPQKPSYKTMEISEEEKIKSEQELFYDIGTTHRDRRPHYERKLENYNWLIQDDATGYTYTTKTTDVGEKDILGCIIEEMQGMIR